MIPGSDTSKEEKKVDKNSVRENIMSMMQLLKSKYNFRYNTVMKFVEYMPKEKLVALVKALICSMNIPCVTRVV